MQQLKKIQWNRSRQKNQDAAEKGANEAKRPKKLKRCKKAKRPKYSALSKGRGWNVISTIHELHLTILITPRIIDDFPTKSLKPSNTNTSKFIISLQWIFMDFPATLDPRLDATALGGRQRVRRGG